MSKQHLPRFRSVHPLVLAGKSLASAAALAATGCGAAQDYDAKPVLDDLVHVVILPTLSDVAARSADLDTSAEALSSDPTAESLAAAQATWRGARAPWRSSDAFAFGPVETEGLGAVIDWWPAKADTIEEKIAKLAFPSWKHNRFHSSPSRLRLHS